MCGYGNRSNTRIDDLTKMIFGFRAMLWAFCQLLILSVSCNNHLPNTDVNLLGRPGEGYYVGVEIGTPPRKFNVLVDTGSTNFAIAAARNPNIDKYYNSSTSSTFTSRHRKVSVLYTQGNWTGELGNDIMNFPSLKACQVACDIALIQTSHNFYMNGSQWEGILGLAYPLIVRPDRQVVSWLDSLQNAYNTSTSLVFSLELCGSKPFKNHHTGQLRVMNDVPISKSLLTTRIVKEWFYEVVVTEIVVGNTSLDLPCREFNMDKTIVDSGTTNLRFPSKVFNAVVKQVSSAALNSKRVLSNEFWSQQKMSCSNEDLDWNSFPNISISLRHKDNSFFTLEITAQSYIRMAYDSMDLNHPYCYKFAVESSDTGSVLGVVVMEGFLVVFNRTAGTVGFEKSRCGPPVSITGSFKTDQDLNLCETPRDPANLGALQMFAYIVASLLCICALIFVYCFTKWMWRLLCRQKMSRSTSETSLMSDDD